MSEKKNLSVHAADCDLRSVCLLYTSGVCAAGIRLSRGRETPAALLAALAPAGVFLAMSLLTEGKIGKGDGLMLLVLGLLLGWRLCLSVLCTASLLAGVWAGIGMTAGKLRKTSRLPLSLIHI